MIMNIMMYLGPSAYRYQEVRKVWFQLFLLTLNINDVSVLNLYRVVVY